MVIDEVSMVRADLLDAIDDALRRLRRSDKPFGGMQMLLIGDLEQLAPVVREEEWRMLSQYYASPYFFDSRALKATDYATIELKQVFRQDDMHFVELLNKIRSKDIDDEALYQHPELSLHTKFQAAQRRRIHKAHHTQQLRTGDKRQGNGSTAHKAIHIYGNRGGRLP